MVTENYLAEDGFCRKGTGYYEYSYASTILLWHIYARFTGREIGGVVPERFKRSRDLLFHALYEEKLPAPPASLPKEKMLVFRSGGLLSYRNDGVKLLFCVENNPYTAHYHKDRGQVILEANGQILLSDLGTTNYSNLASAFMGGEDYHNLAHPVGLPLFRGDGMLFGKDITGTREGETVPP
jgi:hypothetical protein